jgi:CopG family nickel-responsive transcriptional regulator
VQHEHHDLVVSTSHAHLDHDACLEVLIVHGKSAEVEQFADRMIGLKGVQHGRLVMTVPSVAAESHGHNHSHEHRHNSGHSHTH